MTKKHNHIHKYIRRTIGKNYVVFACAWPNCNHYIAKHLLLPGKMSICNRCNQPFTLSKTSLELVKPHCDQCTKVRPKSDEGITLDDTAEFLRQKGLL